MKTLSESEKLCRALTKVPCAVGVDSLLTLASRTRILCVECILCSLLSTAILQKLRLLGFLKGIVA